MNTAAEPDLLDRVRGGEFRAFALLHRPESGRPGTVDVLAGEVSTPPTLATVPLPTEPVRSADPAAPTADRHDVLLLVPYRQLTERGYRCADDGEALLALTVTHQSVVPTADIPRRIPDVPITVTGGHFTPDDAAYADTVKRVLADEIGTGAGANFVVKRDYRATLADYTPATALALFRRLLHGESGAYWTFLVHVDGRTFVGATPERHVTLSAGTVVMNPISGTYRYEKSGPTLSGVLDFLADRKESDELYMVLDEELKMMARICPDGGRVIGPNLREMARLAHTEYFIEGRSDRDPRTILHETMFAPTVTGSPLENACRVIARHEPAGRGYYSGVAALLGRDAHGRPRLDSSILIRTADVDRRGRLRIGVGATLVRHSDPAAEVAETRSKAAGLLAALGGDGGTRFGAHPSVRAALAARNATVSRFWLAEPPTVPAVPAVARRRVLIVDAEDTFTAMLAQQLRALGLAVTVRRFDEPHPFDTDLVVLGPGPGDPTDRDLPKLAVLRTALDALLAQRRPFLAVCLSHQLLSRRLGFPLRRRAVPNQGAQREIDLFGRRERVGFYNTFAAHSTEDKADCPGIGVVEVSRDLDTGEVHALRGPHFASMQFHAESVLTFDGPRILADRINELPPWTGAATG